ncbi:MAG: outer membrane lipoprotein carrier protein LolA [Desulfuromonadales bacterium]|nr:outer membrane lipoprotein carrier protein LolA [Desulfuromonadales bacterium]
MKRPSALMTHLFSLFLLLVVAGHAVAADKIATLQDVVAALEKGYATLQDVQADFSQKTIVAGIKKEQRGSGEVFLKRPGSSTAMFRFNYAKPKQQIVSNGKQVWFYLPDSKQVMVSSVADMFKGGNGIALSYLTGMGHVSRDFSIAFAREQQDKNGNYQLELIPKKATPVLAKLSLSVSSEAVKSVLQQGTVKDIFPIVSSVVHDAGGNETRIEYNRTRVNRGVDSGKFNFKIPQGVEVIKP